MTAQTAAREEPSVGKELSSRSWVIDDAMLDAHYNGVDLSRPAEGSGLPLVPTMLASEPDGNYFNQISFSNHIGHLWMRQEWEFFKPLEVGGAYETTGSIVDIYQKRDRTVVKYGVDLCDASGALAVRSHHHQSFLLEQKDLDVTFRDPKAKPGARKFGIPEGEPFGGLERAITLDMCDHYWAGDKNYHSNRIESEKLGFKDVVVGGRMTMPYAAHILEARYGAAWWTSGKLDIKFTNPVWLDDTVTARGVEIGPMQDDPERTECFVWLAKPDDTIVLVAAASLKAE